MKMGRRLRCSSVTYRFRYAPSSRQSGSDRLAGGPFSSQRRYTSHGLLIDHHNLQETIPTRRGFGRYPQCSHVMVTQSVSRLEGSAQRSNQIYTAEVFIHKDIKQANILADPITNKAWFTGFGISSRLIRERQAVELPEMIAGTLAYMAPEQTGRMNRSIDSRSDLYSLGVTFYQMLTGCLPFTASDPMEWVHCHIAKQPSNPSERRPEVP